MAIYFTSDLHFCHNREFLYAPRGFKNVYDMNDAIVKNWNGIINMDDDIYVLGDLMLNDNKTGLQLIKALKGRIHVILGNHDTDARIELYKDCYNIVEVTYAAKIRYNGYNFFLTHYPCVTGSLEKESLKKCLINLYGHTHQRTNFYQDMPFMYHVGVDSHSCMPISLDDIIIDCEEKVKECLKQL